MKYLIAIVFSIISLKSLAQTDTVAELKWSLRTNFVLSGSSDESDPEGYIVYSGLAFEPTVERIISRSFSISLNTGFQSHEIDFEDTTISMALGSVELIPVNLLLKYNILKNKFRPYISAGVNATFCWEKSGYFNSTDLSTSVGPAIALGFDVSLNKRMLFNFNIGWNKLRTDVTFGENALTSITMDPLSIGTGIGFRF